MFNNVGLVDRLIRFILAGFFFYLGLVVYQDSLLGTGLAIFAVIPALTGLFGSCALYGLLGINTRSSSRLPKA